MPNLLNSLRNLVNKLMNASAPESAQLDFSPTEQVDFSPALQTDFRPGSLQDQLLAVSRPVLFFNIVDHNELSAGPPPLAAQYKPEAKVVELPKRQGARVIVWSKLSQTSRVA